MFCGMSVFNHMLSDDTLSVFKPNAAVLSVVMLIVIMLEDVVFSVVTLVVF
jgi:hypothetical protein